MTKKTNSSNPKQKTSIDNIKRDISTKEASLQKLTILINKNNQDELTKFLFDEHNKYILHDAVEDKKQELIEKILELAKPLIEVTYNGLTVLHSAVKGNANLDIIEMLIKTQPNLAYTKDNQYKTPLDQAEESIKIKILEYYTECYTASKQQFSGELWHDWNNEEDLLDYLGNNSSDDEWFI